MVNLPKISIVTPSFNQGQFLESTIQSVLNQNYPNLEYIIIDGGSTDNSVEIIQKYEKELTYWCSQPDQGQYDAINKGFSKASGEIFAWINSDDMYFPKALDIVGNIFGLLPDVKWLTTTCQGYFDWDGYPSCSIFQGCSRESFLDGCYLPLETEKTRFLGFIQQESTFWHRSLWQKVQGLNVELNLAADFDLWAKFFEYENLYVVDYLLGGFRYQAHQKSRDKQQYMAEAVAVLSRIRSQHNWKPTWRRRLMTMFKLWRFTRLSLLFGYSGLKVVRADRARLNNEWMIKSYKFL